MTCMRASLCMQLTGVRAGAAPVYTRLSPKTHRVNNKKRHQHHPRKKKILPPTDSAQP